MMRDKNQQCAYVYKFSLIAFVIVLLLPILLWCMASNPYIPVRPVGHTHSIHASDTGAWLQGGGQDEWRTCEFDIYIDDILVKSVNNTHKWKTSQFKTEEYELPYSVLKGKKEVRIKFVAKKGKQIGQIYGVRLLAEKQ